MDKKNLDHIEVVIDSQKKLGKELVEFFLTFRYHNNNGLMYMYVSKELVDDPHVDLDLFFKQEINDWVIQNPPPELSEGVMG